MRLHTVSSACFALLVAATLSFGHYTWLVRTHYSPAGDVVYLEFGHGHSFPVSEEAPSTSAVKAFLATADGKRTPVALSAAEKSEKSVKVEVKLPSKNLARVYYVRERGVWSQTASGWQEGGRDKFPDAKVARKSFQAGIAWVGFAGTTNNAAPLGLDLELNYESGIRGRLVRAWRKGKPLRDLQVTAVLPGEREVKLGKTDRDGYVKVLDEVPARTAVLFTATLTEKAPKGANYDEDALSVSLALPAE